MPPKQPGNLLLLFPLGGKEGLIKSQDQATKCKIFKALNLHMPRALFKVLLCFALCHQEH